MREECPTARIFVFLFTHGFITFRLLFFRP